MAVLNTVLRVGIGNHEQRQIDDTVVVALQRVQTANNTTEVLEERELQRLQASVPDNETWQHELNVTRPWKKTELSVDSGDD